MNRAIGDHANESARAFTKYLVERDFAGNVAKAARVMGVSKAGLGDFLRGTKGAGYALLSAIAKYSKASIDTITGGDLIDMTPHKRNEMQPPPRITPRLPPDALLSDHPDWKYFVHAVVSSTGGHIDEEAATYAGLLPIGGIVGPITHAVALAAYHLAEAILQSIYGGLARAQRGDDEDIRAAYETWAARVHGETERIGEQLGINDEAMIAREVHQWRLAREMPDLIVLHHNDDGTVTTNTAAGIVDGEPGTTAPTWLPVPPPLADRESPPKRGKGKKPTP